MRGSFGGSSGGMGGGSVGGGGGSMQLMRTVQRAVRAGAAQDPFSHTNTTNTSRRARQSSSYKSNNSKASASVNNVILSSSSTSSPFSNINLPISAASTAPTWPTCSSPTFSEDSDWECIDGYVEDDIAPPFYDDCLFGSVPSKDEVQHAVFSLHEVLEPAPSEYSVYDRPAYNLDKGITDKESSPTGSLCKASSFGAKQDWLEPSLHLCNSSSLQPYRPDRIYDAFHLLQNDPSVQRMVVSLSSDRAVWDAVLNNEVVRELRESINQADGSSEEEPDKGSDESDPAAHILVWIVSNVKAKITEVIQNITKLVNELFSSPRSEKEDDADPIEEKLRASFMLSVVVLLIVVLNRANKA